MNQRQTNTLVFLVVFIPFLCFFGYMSLVMISIGSLAGVIIGLAFLFTTIFSVYFVYGLVSKGNQALAKQEEIEKHSTPISTWEGSTASIVEMPNESIQIRFGALNFCQHLTKLSSLMIKCPNCKHEFPRFYASSTDSITKQELFSLRNGGLSASYLLLKQIRKDGFPSSFHCPNCYSTIIRSREPSGVCQKTNQRVYGEKLVSCTINQCKG